MSKPLQDNVALITGSGRGIGRQHALLLTARGATVIVQDIDPDLAAETARLVGEKGGKAIQLVCDVAHVAELGEKIAEAEHRLGRIDILVNNAGVGKLQTLEEVSEADFDWMFSIHVKGTFFATKAVVPGMRKRRRGKIINTASTWGMAGYHKDSHYCAAKAAVLGLTKAWAKELAPYNIHVNAVAPGMVMTELTRINRSAADIREFEEKLIPLGRLADPVEISYAVAFLASSESDFITGQVISPNGGEFIVGI